MYAIDQKIANPFTEAVATPYKKLDRVTSNQETNSDSSYIAKTKEVGQHWLKEINQAQQLFSINS